MSNLKTKSWIIGILVGSLIATIVVGLVHETEILGMFSNTFLHILEDWIIVLIPLLPITYITAKLIG